MNRFLSIIALILFDVLAIFIAIALAVSLRKIFNIFFDVPVIDYSYLSFGSAYITLIFILVYFGIYTKRFDFWHETKIVIRSSFLSFAILLAGLVLDQNAEYYSRSTLILIFLLTTITIPSTKLITKKLLYKIGIWKKQLKSLQIMKILNLHYLTTTIWVMLNHQILIIIPFLLIV